jgi:hypothetical protein
VKAFILLESVIIEEINGLIENDYKEEEEFQVQ